MTSFKQCSVFVDLDGVTIKHCTPDRWYEPIQLLPGVKERFAEWERDSTIIVIVTGRKESTRDWLEDQLEANELYFDHLLMGMGSGMRMLINDIKSDGSMSCCAYNVERDRGLVADAIVDPFTFMEKSNEAEPC